MNITVQLSMISRVSTAHILAVLMPKT